MLKSGMLAVVGVLWLSSGAQGAVSIQYRLAPMGGNVYRYIYSISNTGPTGSVALFDILFDTTLYNEASLQIVTPAGLHAQWSEQLLAAVPGLPATYDALALQGGIAPGTTVTGFSVQFIWTGQGLPGAQPFQIVNPSTFQVISSGTTVAAPVEVPTLSTTWLLVTALGLATAAAVQTRFRLAELVVRNGHHDS